jgi:hypothetical protein
MRTQYDRSKSSGGIPSSWIFIVLGIIALLFVGKYLLSGTSSGKNGSALTISPGENSAVYIAMNASSKNRIK